MRQHLEPAWIPLTYGPQGCESGCVTTFRSLCESCLRLFGAHGQIAEHIVDIWVDDTVRVDPHGREGVRVAFTLTYPGVNGPDGPAHSALIHLFEDGGA